MFIGALASKPLTVTICPLTLPKSRLLNGLLAAIGVGVGRLLSVACSTNSYRKMKRDNDRSTKSWR